MTEEKETSWEPSEEWLKWMEIFDADDTDGKMRAIDYLLLQLVDSAFENTTRLKRIENVINIQTRQMTRGGNYLV